MFNAPHVSRAATGVEVRAIRFATDPRRLERDAAAAAEGIPDARLMAEAAFTELANQIGEALGVGSEMGVNFQSIGYKPSPLGGNVFSTRPSSRARA